MKDIWVKFGCFLTGYNYAIVRNSSEASAKAVKKYLSALIIVGGLWGFIGFSFTQRYLHGSPVASIIGAIVMIILVIQIERQIILSVGKHFWAALFRVLIGLTMAIIGSIILDQVTFKDDIEKAQISNIQLEVNKLLPIKTQELTNQIQELDKSIASKESERVSIIGEISKNPTIYSPSSVIEYKRDSASKKFVATNKTTTSNSIQNPKVDLIPQIDAQIKYLREQKNNKETEKVNIQQVLEADLKSKVGFLDELKTLFSILFSSLVALSVWVVIFLFFLSIELFVLVIKFGDSENDYDKTIVHQMETRIRMLEKLVEKKG
jgi:hypothetical protein